MINTKLGIPMPPGKDVVFQQDLTKGAPYISPSSIHKSGCNMQVRVVNPCNTPLTVYQNERLGYIEPVEKVSVFNNEKTQPADLPDRLKDLNLESTTLSQMQQKDLKSLLTKWKHLFALSDAELPGTNVVEHEIHVTCDNPIKQQQYRVPVTHRQELGEKLDALLDAGIISPSNSPWASPLVLVKKSDGTIRPCVDLRKVNEVTVGDSYPLPRVDEAMEFLSGAKYLTTLDLHSGFHQVPVQEESKKYTAFITSRGLFHYNFMPFGLKNAPATFSRLMQFVLSGLHFQSCILYLDDILVASPTWEDHLKHLEEVFQRLDHYHLRLKLKKCNFARQSLPFLGFEISTT